jgi:hypothetical protein
MGLPDRRICLARVPDSEKGALALSALVGAVALRPLMRELPRTVTDHLLYRSHNSNYGLSASEKPSSKNFSLPQLFCWRRSSYLRVIQVYSSLNYSPPSCLLLFQQVKEFQQRLSLLSSLTSSNRSSKCWARRTSESSSPIVFPTPTRSKKDRLKTTGQLVVL